MRGLSLATLMAATAWAGTATSEDDEFKQAVNYVFSGNITAMKICALLVPKEMKVEHSNAIKNLTDEQLEAMIEYLKASLEAQAQSMKVIEGDVIKAASLPGSETTEQPALPLHMHASPGREE